MTSAVANFEVQWIDAGFEPQAKPDPLYPNGIDLDMSSGAAATCSAALPYPARRCGRYVLRCRTCRQIIAVTTAGRRDDPRSVKIACKLSGGTKAN
jgi:hypothetical protein